jgi:hypothetical protein
VSLRGLMGIWSTMMTLQIKSWTLSKITKPKRNLMSANPFDYLVALQRYPSVVFRNSNHWMPWNFKEAIAACKN